LNGYWPDKLEPAVLHPTDSPLGTIQIAAGGYKEHRPKKICQTFKLNVVTHPPIEEMDVSPHG